MTPKDPQQDAPKPEEKADICLREELLRIWDSQMPPDPMLDGIRHILEEKNERRNTRPRTDSQIGPHAT